jgi:hypothetical protein
LRGGKGRKFATIKPGIWETKKLRAATPNAKLLAMYLMTNPHFCMVGIYRIPQYFMETDTGLNSSDMLAALSELIELEFCEYDSPSEVVWVRDMALSQVSDNPNEKQQTGIINELARLHFDHEYPFVQQFLENYSKQYTFLPQSIDGLSWA